MPSQDIRVCSIPDSNLNPYIAAINRELGRLGVAFTGPVRNPKDIEPLLAPGLILHFHWPSLLYRGATREEFARRTTRLLHVLDRAKAVGGYVVWTAHNLVPHENPFPDLDRDARQQFIRRCDHILVHCRPGERELAANFRHLPEVTVVPHPNYGPEYSPPPTREAARATLGMPNDDFVFLMFGMLRDYKNFPLAVAAFRQVDLPRMRLTIAGGPLIGGDTTAIRSLVAGDDRIDLRADRIPHEAVPALFAAANVALFSYDRILASGGVALAQTMARAVVAPRTGCLPDMVPENSGLLYDVGSRDGLSAAMRRIVGLDVDEMGRHGRMHVARQSPSTFAATLFGIYRSLHRR